VTGLHLPAGSLAADGWDLVLSPERAGWGRAGLRVATLPAGGSLSFGTGADEALVVPLAGAFTVTYDGDTVELAGRPGAFDGRTDTVYLPRGGQATVSSAAGGRFAVASARATRGLPLRHLPADAGPVELRGAGPASREVHNLGVPGVLDADALIVCEVLTPGGNWSSYPPHKHDEARTGPDGATLETRLEEVYYFELAGGPAAVGYQRVYGSSPDRPVDVLVEVRTGDVVLVPHGWHGPSMAAPGYDLYYLNVMAGPGERAWVVCDDPDHAWVRGTWAGQATDPRLPFRPGRST
jgi:5-deoxy-glucuronate isomerase